MEHAPLPEHTRLRKAASDGLQAAIWIVFFMVLAALLVLGIGWGLGRHWSVSAPEIHPGVPTLPGNPPRPEKP